MSRDRVSISLTPLTSRMGHDKSGGDAARKLHQKGWGESAPLTSPKMNQRKAVGIDLGTTFSAVAHIDAYGKPQIIPNAESERITPSVILFDGSNVIVGTTAKNNAVAEPEKIVDFVKREMGKPKEQFHREFAGKVYSAEECSALILKKLKLDAEKYLKQPITDAVITVPAYFNDAERTATITAGQLAGFNVLQIINEPTAAALAYGLDKLNEDQTVFVFDLGGGTFDVTIMRIQGQHINMIATNGDHRLGGKDWDDTIVNHMAEEFDRQHGENPLLDLQSYQDLHTRASSAKIQLSSRMQTAVVHHHNGKSVKLEITRNEFERRSQHLVEKCKTICEMVMQEANMTWDDIDKILLVGGMTRMPMVRTLVSQLTKAPVIDDVNPDEVVPKGSPVELTYEYNANQVLEVSVEASGNRAKVSIERNTGLAPNEVAQAAANLGSLRVA